MLTQIISMGVDMGVSPLMRLATVGGECFDVDYEGQDRFSDRDGISYAFRLTNLKPDNGVRLVSVCRFGLMELPPADSTVQRLEMVRLDVIRRALDSRTLDFEPPFDEHGYKELRLSANDFTRRNSVTDEEIKQFIIVKAYWISWKLGGRQPVQFDDPVDLDYLGVDALSVRKHQWLLEQRNLLEKSKIPGLGRPTAQLIDLYDAKHSAQHLNERVFPQGTQYEAFKTVSAILFAANNEILIVDNYLNDEVLDMLAAVPKHPALKLLTYKPRADFRVAVRRFMSQYGGSVEVRIHNADIHDRAVVVDNEAFYTFGHSIKDLGTRLSVVNRLDDPSTLRAALQRIWAAASTLCPACGNEFHMIDADTKCENCKDRGRGN